MSEDKIGSFCEEVNQKAKDMGLAYVMVVCHISEGDEKITSAWSHELQSIYTDHKLRAFQEELTHHFYETMNAKLKFKVDLSTQEPSNEAANG